SFAIWVYSTGTKWSQTVTAQLEAMFKPLVDMNPQLQIKYFDLMLVLPSVVLIMWMGALYLAILLEARLVQETEGTVPAMRQQLNDLRMPDGVIWLFILSLLATFGG